MVFNPDKLSPEEREKLAELMAKMDDSPTEDPQDPPEEDPPEVAVGPRLRTREILQKWFTDGVVAKGRRFIEGISSPRKDTIKAGASDLAEARYSSAVRTAIEEKRRQKILGKMTFDDWAVEVAKLREEDWVTPTTRKADKWGKKWDKIEGLRLYILEKLDKMPVDTAPARKAKMAANLECMRILGQFSKGVVDLTEAKRRVDEATK